MQDASNTINSITKNIEEVKNKQKRWITQFLKLKIEVVD